MVSFSPIVTLRGEIDDTTGKAVFVLAFDAFVDGAALAAAGASKPATARVRGRERRIRDMRASARGIGRVEEPLRWGPPAGRLAEGAGASAAGPRPERVGALIGGLTPPSCRPGRAGGRRPRAAGAAAHARRTARRRGRPPGAPSRAAPPPRG